MNKYNNSKIYKLFSPSTGLTYIGSTCEEYLSRRLAGHVRNYKNFLNGKYNYVSSFEVLECEDYIIELIEKVNVSDKDELRKKEGEYIRKIECVNKKIEGRTKKEYYEEYYENNKDKIREYTKEYRHKNKDKIREYTKEYRHKNKDKIKERSAEKIECKFCGSFVRRNDISTHKRTKKCLKHQ